MNWVNSGLRGGVATHPSNGGAILELLVWEGFGIMVVLAPMSTNPLMGLPPRKLVIIGV